MSPRATAAGAHAFQPVLHKRRNHSEGPDTAAREEPTFAITREKPAQQWRLSTEKIKKLIIINSVYVSLYNILFKMKKLVRRVTLFQNFENLFNVQLYRKLEDFHICFYIAS